MVQTTSTEDTTMLNNTPLTTEEDDVLDIDVLSSEVVPLEDEVLDTTIVATVEDDVLDIDALSTEVVEGSSTLDSDVLSVPIQSTDDTLLDIDALSPAKTAGNIAERPGYPAEAEISGGVNVMAALNALDAPRAANAAALIATLEGKDLTDIEQQFIDTWSGEDHPMMGEYYNRKLLEMRDNPDSYPILSPLLVGTEKVLDIIPQTGEVAMRVSEKAQDFLTVISACGQFPTQECIAELSTPIAQQRAGEMLLRIEEAELNSNDLSGMFKILGHTVGFATDVLIDPITYTNPIVSFINKGKNLVMSTQVAQRISKQTGMSIEQVKHAFTHSKYGQPLVQLADEAWTLFNTKHKLDKIKIGDKTAWDYQSAFKNLVAAARIKAIRDNKELQTSIKSYAERTNTPVDDINMFITEAVERGGIQNVDMRHLNKESIEALSGSPQLREIIKGLQVKNENQLAAELDAGIKVTKLENAPLIVKGGDTELYLQYMNHAILPEARDIVLKAGDEAAPLFIQKAGEAKGNIFTTKHSSTYKRKEDWAGLTLTDINDLAKQGHLPGYEGKVFENGFFHTDPAILQAIRDNKHYRTLAAAELAEGIKGLGVAGDDILKAARDSGWKPHNKGAAKDATVALNYLKKDNPNQWGDLTMTKNQYTGGQAFPGELAKFIDNSLEFIHTPKQMNMFRQGWEGMTRWYKAWTLSIFPSYHVRNTVGNMWNNFVVGVKPQTYKDALHIQHAIAKGSSGTFKLKNGDEVPYKQIRDWADEHGVTGRGIFAIDIETSLVNELGRAKWATLSSENKAIAIGKRVGEHIEDNARMANFIDGLNKGISPEKAGKRVRHTLFDYGDLTEFEQGVMKNLMPFYTWSRKNIPFQLEQMIKQPGKYKAVDTAQREIEASVEEANPNEKLLAKWMLINMPTKVRLDDDGKPQYFLLGGWLPAADIWKLASAPATVPTDLLHPVVASFMESSLRPTYTKNIEEPTGFTTLFGDRQIKYGEVMNYMGITMDKSTAHYLDKIRVLSTLDDFYQPFNEDRMKSPFAKPKTAEEALIRFFTGIKLHTADFKAQKSFRVRELEAQIKNRKDILKKNFPYDVQDKDFKKIKNLLNQFKQFRRGGLVTQAERLGFSKGGELSLGEQQRLVDYSNTEDSLLPVTEGTPEPTMSEGISSDWNKRLESMDESRRDRESGEISLARSTVNTAGALAGGAFDTGGRLIEESVDTYLDNLKSFAPTTYNKVADKVTETKEWALNTDAGKAAVEAAQAGYEKYSVWKEANPQDAKTFESVLNIGMFGWGAKGVSSQVNKLFDKPIVNTVDNIVPEKPVLPPVATKKKAPVRDKEAEDTELTTLAEGLTESGGFKYKLPTMLLDLTVKDKVGDSKPSQWKYNINRWVKKGKIKKEELDDSRLMGWLDTQAADTKIATKDIFSFMKENSPLLKTYTSKIGNRRDDEWYNSQPLIQERVAVEGDYHNKLQEVGYLQDKDNIGDITADNKELVLKAAGWLHFTSVENIITGDYNTQIDSDFKKFFAKSAYADKAIEREITQAKFINDVDSVFHPDQPEFNSAQHRDEMINTILGTGNPQRRNSHILGAIIEDVNQAYLKAEGSERELLNNYVDTFVAAGKAKAEHARFTYDNKTELRDLSTEALRRNAGDVAPNTWNNYALPNTRGKPVTILVQSKVGSEDRLKKLREFHKSVEDARIRQLSNTGEVLGAGLSTLERIIAITEKSRNQGGLSTSDTKRLIKDRLSLKKQLADFKKKTGVAWEDRDTYINKAETELYLEPHYTGIYGESPLKKGIPQENIILHIRGNVVEQSSFGEGKGLFINEQQSQAHQAAMGNARHFENLTEIAPGLRGISGYAKLDAGPKAAKLIEKKRSIQRAIDNLWADINVPANIALEHPDVKRISKIVTPMDEEIADIEMELRHLTGLPSNERMNLIFDESIPENLSHKKDWTPLAMKQSIKYAVDNNLNYIVLPIERHSISQIEHWGDNEPGVMQAIIDRNSIYSPRAYRSIVKKWDKDAKPFEDEYLDSDERGNWTEGDIHKVVVLPITKAIREGIKKDGLTAYRRGGLVTQMKALIPNG